MEKLDRAALTARKEITSDVKRSVREWNKSVTAFREMVGKQSGMTINDVACCEYIVENGQATAGKLAKLTGLTSGAVTGVVMRLERLGYITSERSSRDRRQLVLKSNKKILQWHLNFYGPVLREMQKLYATYTVQQLNLILDNQTTIAKIFSKAREKIISTKFK